MQSWRCKWWGEMRVIAYCSGRLVEESTSVITWEREHLFLDVYGPDGVSWDLEGLKCGYIPSGLPTMKSRIRCVFSPLKGA